VLAEEQAEGRGRQGRSWTAPRGRALTLSIVLRIEAESFTLLPLAAAVAVCEACEQAAPVNTKIKWPNDVWIDGLKVAGILIEARPQEGWAVLGIGLNVGTRRDEFPEELQSLATSLQAASAKPIGRDSVLDALLNRLAERLESPPDALLFIYRERDALHGKHLSWAGGSGTADGIDERGNLVVFSDEGERVTLDAGEVHLLRS